MSYRTLWATLWITRHLNGRFSGKGGVHAACVVRFRSVAAPAAASPAPRQARYFVCSLLLTTALAAVAGCSTAAVRGEPSNLGDRVSTTIERTTVPPTTGHSRTTTTAPAASLTAREVAVEAAWASSKTAFYRAALLQNPKYPPLLATLVRGGPVEVHSIAYLTGLTSAGVRGPPTWRVGNEHVVKVTGTRARVEGCLFDTGSVWKATGKSAPASLGGGAGLTASDATLVLEGGKWLVLSDDVSAVSSPKEPGPCHGF